MVPVQCHDNELIEQLLQAQPVTVNGSFDLAAEQLKDPDLFQLIQYMKSETLPADENKAKKVAAQAPSFSLLHNILYFVDSKNSNRKRCVVPAQMRKQLMEENHSGPRLVTFLLISSTGQWLYTGGGKVCIVML